MGFTRSIRQSRELDLRVHAPRSVGACPRAPGRAMRCSPRVVCTSFECIRRPVYSLRRSLVNPLQPPMPCWQAPAARIRPAAASLPPINAMTSLLGSHNPHSCSVGLIRLPGARRHTEEHDDRCPNSKKRQDLMKQAHIHGAKKTKVSSGPTKGCNHLAAAPPLSPRLRIASHLDGSPLQMPMLCWQHSAD